MNSFLSPAGGLTVGGSVTPAAAGTINVAGGLLKNGTPYTHP